MVRSDHSTVNDHGAILRSTLALLQTQRAAHDVVDLVLVYHTARELCAGTAGEQRHILAAVCLRTHAHQCLLMEVRVGGVHAAEILFTTGRGRAAGSCIGPT